MVCYEATCHAMWLRNFISALEVVHFISKALKLFCDNSVVVSFYRNTMSTSRSKHIELKFFFVKEKVTESFISVEHTPMTMDKKIGFFDRFFGEKSVFGGAGKDFRVEKSEVKKSAKNRRFFR